MTILIGAAVAAVPASAHPDHGAGAAVSAFHYVSDPFHIAVGVVTVAAGLLVLGVWRARRGRSLLG